MNMEKQSAASVTVQLILTGTIEGVRPTLLTKVTSLIHPQHIPSPAKNTQHNSEPGFFSEK